jgi:hypothetical protein
MPEFPASTRADSEDRDENLPRLPQQQLDSNGRCSLYRFAPGRSNDNKSWY